MTPRCRRRADHPIASDVDADDPVIGAADRETGRAQRTMLRLAHPREDAVHRPSGLRANFLLPEELLVLCDPTGDFVIPFDGLARRPLGHEAPLCQHLDVVCILLLSGDDLLDESAD